MRYNVLLFMVLTVVFSSTLFAADAKKGKSDTLECKIIEETDKLIRCTYHTSRTAKERNVTFTWRSANTPQDDREYTAVLKAQHGSIYDYRYYYGRAYGEWDVTVTDDEGNTLSATSFTIK